MSWKRLDRKILIDTKFLKVFEDTVELPNGKILDDYTVVQKPSFVMIVATDKEGKLICIEEYKYAADEVMSVLPAGHINEGESPLETGKRELLEETGYSSDEWEELGQFYDFPTKDLNKVYFVKAINAKKASDSSLDDTEEINVRLISVKQLKEEVGAGRWKANATLAALVMGGIYS